MKLHANYKLVNAAHKHRKAFKWIYGAFPRTPQGRKDAMRYKSLREQEDGFKSLKLAIV